MAQVIVGDPLAPEGIALLTSAGHEVVDITQLDEAARAPHIAAADAWIIRSGTQIRGPELDAALNLKAIGRAGVGVDNIDLAAATARGVAVFNAPTGNITSACEQAWALLLAGARRVAEGDAAMKNEDWARKRLRGTELAGKTLFIIGLGKIGRMMAARAQAFEMETLGYDPFVTPEAAKAFGVEWVELPDGYGRADIVSLHTPLVGATKNMIDADALASFKDGSILVNAARGGLMVADDVLAALDSGKLAFAGIDVWPEEPPTDWSLAKHPKVVAAPHLGASTTEAQVKAATQAVQRVIDFLDTGDAALAVNAQAVVPDALRPWADLATALTSFAAQTVTGLESVVVAGTPSVDAEALELAAAVGALRAAGNEAVNAISAPGLVQDAGWTLASRRLPDDDDAYLRIYCRSKRQEVVIEGTYTPHYGPRVTSLDSYDVEFRPSGRFLFTRHDDVPGVLAAITRCLAEADVNVANVSLARKPDGSAVAVIAIDGSIPRPARDALRQVAAVREAHRIRIE